MSRSALLVLLLVAPFVAAQDNASNGQDPTGSAPAPSAWLTFQPAPPALAVRDVAYLGEAFFTSVEINATQPTPTTSENTVVLESPEATMTLVDAESADVEVSSRANVTVVLHLAPGVRVTHLDAEGARVESSTRAADVLGPVAFTNDGSLVAFLTDSERIEIRFSSLATENAEPAAEAFRNGTLGGEVTVEETPQGDTRVVSVDHGNATVTASVVGDQAIVIVSSTSHQARVVIVNLRDPSFRPGPDGLRVLLDGKRVREADNATQAFDAANATEPLYLLTEGRAETQVVVALPHLSTHTIQIQSLVTQFIRDPRAPLAVLGAVVVAVGLGAALVRRK